MLRKTMKHLRNNGASVNINYATIMKDFKARISGCRARKGLSQQELADLIDVSLRSVQNWESGESEPHGKHLRKLSEALETPIPYLLGETAPQTQARNEP